MMLHNLMANCARTGKELPFCGTLNTAVIRRLIGKLDGVQNGLPPGTDADSQWKQLMRMDEQNAQVAAKVSVEGLGRPDRPVA